MDHDKILTISASRAAQARRHGHIDESAEHPGLHILLENENGATIGRYVRVTQCDHPTGTVVNVADVSEGTRCDDCGEILPLKFQDPRRVDILEHTSANGRNVLIEEDVSYRYAVEVSKGTATMRSHRWFRFRNDCARLDPMPCNGTASYVETDGRTVRTVCANHYGISTDWRDASMEVC